VEARLAALGKRRGGRVVGKMLTAGDLTLDPRTFNIRVGDKDVKLPPKCIRLLEALMVDPQRVFSRRELEMTVWGQEQETSDTLRSHIHILRRALVRAGGHDPIENLHGLGYRLVSRNAK
jgi:DNA-binding response OmpR family regulator